MTDGLGVTKLFPFPGCSLTAKVKQVQPLGKLPLNVRSTNTSVLLFPHEPVEFGFTRAFEQEILMFVQSWHAVGVEVRVAVFVFVEVGVLVAVKVGEFVKV